MIGVYGANGFIGRHLVRHLTDRGVPVRAVSRRFDTAFPEVNRNSLELVEADFSHALDMVSSLQDIQTVIQLISSSSPGMRNDHATADIEENVLPHVEFLQSCVKAGIKRYIFLSSGGTVYGPNVPVPTPETCPTNPISSHGLTKLTVEQYIRMHGYVDGLDYVILRVANPFGPGQIYRKGQGLIPAILERSQKGLPIRIFGNGEARRDYIYIDDLIAAIERSALISGEAKQVLNIGSGEARSVNEVIQAIETFTGLPIEREYVEMRSTDVDVACLDITQARNLLSWHPSVEFQEGIKRTVLTADQI